MIKAEGGKVRIEGSGVQIEAELFLIMMAALEECPVQLAIALKKMERVMNKDIEKVDSKEARLAAFAAALSLLPEEERQRLKKEMEGD